MTTPTYLVGPNNQKQLRNNKMKVLHGTWFFSLNKINKDKIKIIVITMCKGIANRHWL